MPVHVLLVSRPFSYAVKNLTIHKSTSVTAFYRVYTSRCKFQVHKEKWHLFHSVKRNFHQLCLSEIVSTKAGKLKIKVVALFVVASNQPGEQSRLLSRLRRVYNSQTPPGLGERGQFQHLAWAVWLSAVSQEPHTPPMIFRRDPIGWRTLAQNTLSIT